MAMSFNESTQIQPASPLETEGVTNPGEFDPTRHIGPVVAHELNNILTIVQGYADRLLLRHGANPAIMTELKLISEASRRAATVIRNAKPPNATELIRKRPATPSISG
jgi:hypothetical protein